ncbi:hypothetical protein JRQ81_010798, partial [Phrynocephalus forsythii]
NPAARRPLATAHTPRTFSFTQPRAEPEIAWKQRRGESSALDGKGPKLGASGRRWRWRRRWWVETYTRPSASEAESATSSRSPATHKRHPFGNLMR